jgi:hypothetical protein
MKKLAAFIIIVLIIAGVWYVVHKHSSVTVITSPTTTTQTGPASHPNPSNATFIFDDGSVTLKSGTALTSTDGDSAIQNETDLTDTVAYGDLNNDGKEDAAVGLIQQGGGSGEFLYIAAYISGNVSYKGTNAVFVGDRVQPKAIGIKNGVITFTYLDRGPNDPMSAEPTISVTKTYVYQNGQIVEK